MKDLHFGENDNAFDCKVSSVIVNEDSTKVLLYQIKGRDEWITPGGRI